MTDLSFTIKRTPKSGFRGSRRPTSYDDLHKAFEGLPINASSCIAVKIPSPSKIKDKELNNIRCRLSQTFNHKFGPGVARIQCRRNQNDDPIEFIVTKKKAVLKKK